LSHRSYERRRKRDIKKIEEYWRKQKEQRDPTLNAIKSAKQICEQRFGYYTDPRFNTTENLDYLRTTTNHDDMPRKPDNLQLHNLCKDRSLVTEDLIQMLGLGLGHGLALEQKEEDPIDFERLRRSIRLQFHGINRDNGYDYNLKLYVPSDWQPDLAPDAVESAINDFEQQTKKAFDLERRKQPLPIFGVKRDHLELL
jgi:hypothetical protein